ncbi:hypothetical protein NE237_019914 [Protea cynaroides]|uniref:Uncharacterized protein n=1 Tax=Protea cynaroides TaxID=273540 RepID=A0A9Q0K158_9MAGN|nr:hypothetical protein NE237_019914 [Protea cynaroides]
MCSGFLTFFGLSSIVEEYDFIFCGLTWSLLHIVLSLNMIELGPCMGMTELLCWHESGRKVEAYICKYIAICCINIPYVRKSTHLNAFSPFFHRMYTTSTGICIYCISKSRMAMWFKMSESCWKSIPEFLVC